MDHMSHLILVSLLPASNFPTILIKLSIVSVKCQNMVFLFIILLMLKDKVIEVILAFIHSNKFFPFESFH